MFLLFVGVWHDPLAGVANPDAASNFRTANFPRSIHEPGDTEPTTISGHARDIVIVTE
jgi:hypothetical protein